MDDQLLNRLSFRRFVGCHEDTVPDAKTIWPYRETLTKSGREKELFDLFYAHLTDERLIAHSSQIWDASFVKCPKQGQSGEKVDGWNKTKRRQKDVDATWTRKGDVRYVGYKNHICADRKSKMMSSKQLAYTTPRS